jgi:hypothetical protein
MFINDDGDRREQNGATVFIILMIIYGYKPLSISP